MKHTNRWSWLLVLSFVTIGLALGPATKSTFSNTAYEAKPTTVPFKMLPTNHMVVEAKINGEGPFRLIFDLGAPITLLGNKAAAQSKVIKPGSQRSLLFGMSGEAQIKTLEVGELEAQDVPVIVMDHPVLKAIGTMLGKPLDGIMGYTFFARYRTTIDYKAREMTFTPVNFEVRDLVKDLEGRLLGPKVATTRVLAPKGLWGFSVGEPTDGVSSHGVPVKEVLRDSAAAAAGLRVGDILTTLDGRWTTSVVDVYAAACTIAAGQSTEVVIRRDGEELTLKIKPTDGI
jgi:hypothetical protein